MIQLRPDQVALKQAIYAEWAAGNRNVLAVAVTGFGKSVVTSDVVLDHDQAGKHQIVMAHRTELVGQMSLHVARRGIYHTVIGPKNIVNEIRAQHRAEFNGRCFVNPNARCHVAGVDTLISRAEEIKTWAPIIHDWTIDEAHHVLRENKWGAAAALFPNAKGLGVTASPGRADGKGLGRHHDGLFDAMVLGPTMRQTINAGNLCDYRIIVPESDFHIDDADVAASGDFSGPKMRKASDESHLVGDVVKEYLRWARGKRGITFAIDVQDAEKIAEAYNAASVRAVAISAKTPAYARAEWIRRFRNGELDQLVNVDLFGEGFDVPAVEVVSMARPTASLAVYLQQFGRALRLMDGKSYGLIIDHVSNYKRHGLPDKPREWTLDRREKRAKLTPDPEEIELKRCNHCSQPYLAALPSCPHCGQAPPLPEPRARTIEMVEGDLMLLDAETLAQMRAAWELESPASMHDRVLAAAGPIAATGAMNRQIETFAERDRLDAALNDWANRQRALGRSDEESYRRIYLTTGFDILALRKGTRSELEKRKNIVEGWK